MLFTKLLKNHFELLPQTHIVKIERIGLLFLSLKSRQREILKTSYNLGLKNKSQLFRLIIIFMNNILLFYNSLKFEYLIIDLSTERLVGKLK